MKWSEAIANLDKSEENCNWADLEDFCNEFGINYYDCCDDISAFPTRMKKYWVHSWYCTDTSVGLAVYCFDGEPVAVSYQSGRNCDESIYFISDELAKKVKDFILTLYTESNKIYFVNLDEEIDQSWFINDDSF